MFNDLISDGVRFLIYCYNFNNWVLSLPVADTNPPCDVNKPTSKLVSNHRVLRFLTKPTPRL